MKQLSLTDMLAPDVPPAPVMIFDVETRRSAADVGGWNHADRMGVSVAVVWDGTEYRSFQQEELDAMFSLLKQASLVVGFNSFGFDYQVLQPFAPYEMRSLPGRDLLVELKKRLNHRIPLDNLGRATLNAPKSADGLQALQWWREGNIEEIRKYCQMDVEVTRRLYEFGKEYGYVFFTDKTGQKARVNVEW